MSKTNRSPAQPPCPPEAVRPPSPTLPKRAPMKVPAPHFLLYSDSGRDHSQGQWKFLLQSPDGSTQVEAEDVEPSANGERLELLALVRGLEAIPEPSRVTLVTSSKYVNRGLAYGLEEWRTNGWQWEHFGQMVPVKHRDLWQRVDRALEFHELVSRSWRLDSPHVSATEIASEPLREPQPAATKSAHRLRSRLRRLKLACSRGLSERIQALRIRVGQLGTRLVPLPWLE